MLLCFGAFTQSPTVKLALLADLRTSRMAYLPVFQFVCLTRAEFERDRDRTDLLEVRQMSSK